MELITRAELNDYIDNELKIDSIEGVKRKAEKALNRKLWKYRIIVIILFLISLVMILDRVLTIF